MFTEKTGAPTFPLKYTARGREVILADATNKALSPPAGSTYVVIRVDPSAVATDGIKFTDDGTDPTVGGNNAIPMLAGETVEISIADLSKVHLTKLAANNVNVYVWYRSYP